MNKVILSFLVAVIFASRIWATTPAPNVEEHDMKTIALAVVAYHKKTASVPSRGSVEIARELVASGFIKPGEKGYSPERGFFSRNGDSYFIFCTDEGVSVALRGKTEEVSKCYIAIFSDFERPAQRTGKGQP